MIITSTREQLVHKIQLLENDLMEVRGILANERANYTTEVADLKQRLINVTDGYIKSDIEVKHLRIEVADLTNIVEICRSKKYSTELDNLRKANAQLQTKVEELQEHIVRLCV
jgi:hypothetical protein